MLLKKFTILTHLFIFLAVGREPPEVLLYSRQWWWCLPVIDKDV